MQLNVSHTHAASLRAVAGECGNSSFGVLAGLGQPSRLVVGLPAAVALGSAEVSSGSSVSASNPALQRTAFGVR